MASITMAKKHVVVFWVIFLPHCTTAPLGLGRPRYRSLTIILRHTTLLNIPLDQ